MTAVLLSAESDGENPVDRLVPLLYDDLRAIAHRQLRRERPGNTLGTTGLVHEAYLKLADSSRVAARGRAYFFAAAARAMRQILVDQARLRGRDKRGPEHERVSDSEVPVLAVDDFAAELLDLHHALLRLSTEHPRAAQVVECRFFGGMNVDETAEAMNVSPRTVKSDWSLSRAWLYRALQASGTDDAR